LKYLLKKSQSEKKWGWASLSLIFLLFLPLNPLLITGMRDIIIKSILTKDPI